MQKPNEFASRRARFLKRMKAGIALVPAAPVAVRNNDVTYDYRQNSDFYYLTGFGEPESLLLLTTAHPRHVFVLFVRPRDREREIWEGPRAGRGGAARMLGADAAYPIGELQERLPEYLADAGRLFYRVGVDRELDDTVFRALDRLRGRIREGVSAPRVIVDPGLILHDLRLRKSAFEVEKMQEAADITRQAFADAMRATRPGLYEYQVEAELLRAFRTAGAEPAYGCVVASGPNATILHYRENRRRMGRGDLLLIDAGAERDYYASDVTRTFPVGGIFSGEQRALYEVVLDAQQAAIEKAGPGLSLKDVHDTAVKELVRGLIKLGLLKGRVETAVRTGAYRQFYMHRTSHFVGMDVHDVGDYYLERKPRPLRPGMVFTVEPGLYVARNAGVDSRWRGIGIRIEDDLLVTAGGCRNLTADIPKQASEIERLLRDRSRLTVRGR